MTSENSVLLLIFAVVAYMIVVDKNVAEYLTLVFKLIKLNCERYWWMIRFHPQNPITNLLLRLKYDRMAKELQKSLEIDKE
jgi:hypothetical protein